MVDSSVYNGVRLYSPVDDTIKEADTVSVSNVEMVGCNVIEAISDPDRENTAVLDTH